MMNWILLLMAGVVAVGIAIFFGGLMIPAQSKVSRTISLNAHSARVIDTLTAPDLLLERAPSLPTLEVCSEVCSEARGEVCTEAYAREQAGNHTAGVANTVKYLLYDDDRTVIGELCATVESSDGATSTLILSESIRTANPLVRFFSQFGNRTARIEMFAQAVSAELSEQ